MTDIYVIVAMTAVFIYALETINGNYKVKGLDDYLGFVNYAKVS